MPRPVRYLLVVLLVAGLSVGGWYASRYLHQPAPEQSGEPKIDPVTGRPLDPITGKPVGKLVVLVVFDQMRGDYVGGGPIRDWAGHPEWAQHFGTGGFERMKKEGVWYSSVEIPYACTSTGPGHASIATGAPPSVTGIIENEWFDRKAGASVYCAQPLREYKRVPAFVGGDEKASRGSGIGFSPERLLAETVGDKLKAVTEGKSRVFSLSIKDRTAVLMGGKKPDGVYCFDTRDGKIHTGEFYRDRPHGWVEAFNSAAMVNQWFGKDWVRFRPDLDYQAITKNPDAAAGEDRGISQGLIFPHPTDGGLKAIGPKYYEAIELTPYGNELLFELAKKAMVTEKLGAGETADLLCLSFSSNDMIGHRWGPDSWEVLDVTLRSDKLIADLLGFLDANLGKDRYTLVVTADHGVCPLPEQEKFPTAQRISLSEKKNEIFPQLNLKLNDAYGIQPGGPTRWFEANDAKEQDRMWPWIVLNHRAIAGHGGGLKVEDVADTVCEWLKGRAYVETAFTRKQLETETYLPGSFGQKAKLAYHPDRSGDVIAIPKLGVLVTPYSAGTTHGSPQPYDSLVPVLAVGGRIPPLGKRTEKVSSLIVAPILARALGIDPPANAVEKVPAELTK